MVAHLPIFITGATGFIGRFLVEELLKKGYRNLTALVRKTSKKQFLQDKDVRLIEADVSDFLSLAQIKEDYEVVFHCAGWVSEKNRKNLKRINVVGTENICRWAYERKVKKFIYLSSVAVNSGNPGLPLTEDAPYCPTNYYGVSKLEAERMAIKFRSLGLPMVIVRPCMVYGPGEPHLLGLLTCLLKLRLLFLPNRGMVKLHLVSVRNVVDFLLRCLEDNRAEGEVFQIADKEVLTTAEIFTLLAEGLGAPKPLLLSYSTTKALSFLPVLGRRIKFFCKDRVYSIEKVRQKLNYLPPYEAKEELFWTASSFCRD